MTVHFDLATLVDLVVAVLVIESVVLLVAGSRWPWLPPARSLVPNLAAGFLLVMALRCAVHDQGVIAVASLLAMAGIAHLFDLRGRATRPIR